VLLPDQQATPAPGEAAPNGALEQQAERAGVAEAAVPVLAERRVVRDRRSGRKGVRHRTGRIARFVARTGNMAGIN